MENGNGNTALQGPPVIENQRTKQSAKYTYHECMKNYAAVINGNVRDGCGEFMAHGEGTPEALNCAACNCHRSFHRKQIIEDVDEMEVPEKIAGHPTNMQITGPSLTGGVRTKRSRTKFTEEQKENMRGFAKKSGWKLQKTEDSATQQFCQEIGITRKVLKVWMQNNKHIYMGINKTKTTTKTKNKNKSSSSNQT